MSYYISLWWVYRYRKIYPNFLLFWQLITYTYLYCIFLHFTQYWLWLNDWLTVVCTFKIMFKSTLFIFNSTFDFHTLMRQSWCISRARVTIMHQIQYLWWYLSSLVILKVCGFSSRWATAKNTKNNVCLSIGFDCLRQY